MTELTMDDQPRQVRITTEGTAGRVEVDGTDISRMLQGYTLEYRVGQAPMLVLLASPDAQGVLFDGMAHVVVGDQPEEQDPGELIAAFLGNIDAAALEQAALNRDLDGSKHELTRAMLAQLADWAQGRG